ncbi:hypothetical protein AB1E18_002657 [Capra hircus]
MAAGFLRASKGEKPVPSPQILMGSTSITPDWCNVTLECRASGAREDLNVTWENKGLPKEWEQKRTLERACNSYILAMSLPRGQPNASFVCVVSNPVEYKTTSFDLGGFCVHEPCSNVAILPSGIDSVRVHSASLSGARSQEDSDESIQYVIREQHLKEKGPPTTIYSEVEQKPEGEIGTISSQTSHSHSLSVSAVGLLKTVHKIASKMIPSNMFHFITP